MKNNTNLEEYIFDGNKINEKISTDKESKFSDNDDMILLIKKKTKSVYKDNLSEFRNNYKNYQYDYEEDFYEPRY